MNLNLRPARGRAPHRLTGCESRRDLQEYPRGRLRLEIYVNLTDTLIINRVGVHK